MFQKFYILLLLTGFMALTGCASSSSGGKVSYGGKQRTIDFCSRPSDIGTAFACEAGKRVAKMAFDAAVDAYKSPNRKTTSKRTNREKICSLSCQTVKYARGLMVAKMALLHINM